MDELERLVQAAVSSVARLAGAAKSIATVVLLGTGVVIIGSLMILLAVVSADHRLTVAVIGGAVALFGIGAALLARWRFSAVQRHVPELADEVRSFLSSRPDDRGQFIEAFAVDTEPNGGTIEHGEIIIVGAAGGGAAGYASGDDRDGIGDRFRSFRRTRSLSGLRGLLGSGLDNYGRLADVATAITSFPMLAFTAIAVSIGFAFVAIVASIAALVT